MNKYLLVINAGSSSIKFAVYLLDSSAQLIENANGQIEGIGVQPKFKAVSPQGKILVDNNLSQNNASNHESALSIIYNWLLEHIAEGKLLAVGHRVVHGGLTYTIPVLIDNNVLAELEKLIPLAPLHQSHNLASIRTFLNNMPDLPQVACFDTGFHRTQPEVAQRFGLPRRFFDEGIRRFGFHGLSYEYVASVLPTLDPKLTNARTIVAHLGNGASLCAIKNGRSIATTMGFSPLDGLVMGTRCGNLDPGAMLYLMDHHNMDAKALAHLLYYESGLLGVSGLSNDMRVLLSNDDPQAKEAVALFVYRITREIGSLTAVLGGLDALIFTGGIGENAAKIRAQVCHQATWLGVEIDATANETTDTRISTNKSKVSAWVIHTNENLMIARHTLQQVSIHESKQ